MKYIIENNEVSAFSGTPEQANAIFGENNWQQLPDPPADHKAPEYNHAKEQWEDKYTPPEPTEIEKLTAQVTAQQNALTTALATHLPVSEQIFGTIVGTDILNFAEIDFDKDSEILFIFGEHAAPHTDRNRTKFKNITTDGQNYTGQKVNTYTNAWGQNPSVVLHRISKNTCKITYRTAKGGPLITDTRSITAQATRVVGTIDYLIGSIQAQQTENAKLKDRISMLETHNFKNTRIAYKRDGWGENEQIDNLEYSMNNYQSLRFVFIDADGDYAGYIEMDTSTFKIQPDRTLQSKWWQGQNSYELKSGVAITMSTPDKDKIIVVNRASGLKLRAVYGLNY